MTKNPLSTEISLIMVPIKVDFKLSFAFSRKTFGVGLSVGVGVGMTLGKKIGRPEKSLESFLFQLRSMTENNSGGGESAQPPKSFADIEQKMEADNKKSCNFCFMFEFFLSYFCCSFAKNRSWLKRRVTS